MADLTSAAEQPLDPARGYLIFDELLSHVENEVIASTPTLCGYASDAIGRRLLQRIVEITLYPLIKATAKTSLQGIIPTPRADQSLLVGGLCFRGDRVTVTTITWARNLAEFVIQWIRVIGYLAGPNRNTIPDCATLLMGIGPADLVVDGSDSRFISFCENGPLSPLCAATHLVVENAQPLVSSRPGWVTYSRQPLLALLRARPPRGRNLLRFLGTHLAAAATYFRYSLSHPLTCLIARDIAFHAPAVDLSRRGMIESVVITSSYFQMQPLWMRCLPERHFEVHMAWYSQNTRPFVYKRDGTRSDVPNYRHMGVDTHWVWTEGYAAYIRTLNTTAKVHVVGPILWYLPEAGLPAVPTPSVAIFDVTPVRETFAQKIGLPRNYYSTTNMLAFLEQATIACERVAARLGQPVLVLLKHKRSHGDAHDPRYIEFVDSLAAAGRIHLLPSQTSLYSLIGSSSTVIVAPFSSPAYVASALKVPAIYHDATDSIEATHEPAPFVEFTAGEAVLAERLYAILRAHCQKIRYA
jgi:hypothetical protein